MKKYLKAILGAILFFLILLFFLRLILPRQIDDVNPLIPCRIDYLQKASTLWVIPYYKDFQISKNETWCKQILSLNKTLEMHGIHHTYKEFKYQIDEYEFEEGLKIFENCFNQTPTMFKPPQLAISNENRELLKKAHLKLKLFLNQGIHKVYHCNDTGTLPNAFHDLF